MKYSLHLASGLVLLVLPAAAASPLTCKRSPLPAATLRAEGPAELVSDIVLTCTGGAPVSPGGQAPRFEIMVVSNAPYANRTFPPPVDTSVSDPLNPSPAASNTMPWNDALLLLDEPAAGSQIACTPPDGGDSCTAVAGQPAPNVFQGRQLMDNTVLFRHVPISPPGDGGTRVIRISNLRADATRIPSKPVAGEMSAVVQMFTASGDGVAIQNAEMAGGETKPSYLFSVRTAADGAVPANSVAVITTPALLNPSAAQSTTRFNVKFTEGFADAFRRRNLGASADDPLYVVSQPLPGGIPHTESGFFNGNYPPAHGMNLAGLADSGTRLKVVFEKVPDNVAVFVTTRDVAQGTTGYSPVSAKALLTGSDTTGAGSFNQIPAPGNGLVELPVQDGTAMAVWEIVSSDPSRVEDFSFTVVLAGSPNHAAGLGLATVRGTIAPTTVTPASDGSPLPLPRFQETIVPAAVLPAFQLSATLQLPVLQSVSAASYSGLSVAPESIVTSFAAGLPAATVQGNGLSGTSGIGVDVIDSFGLKRAQSLVSLPANQVNYILDKDTALGTAVVNVSIAGRPVATGFLQVEAVAPGLFSADGSGSGPAVGQIVRIGDSGNLTAGLARYDAVSGTWSTAAADLGGASDTNILSLYGTGLRRRSALGNVSLTIGGEPVPILFVGPQTGLDGVDLVSAGPLPGSLRGRGEVSAVLTVDGKTANRVNLRIN